MASPEFIRQLPSTGAIHRTIWQRIHVDPILFLLLLMISGYGLFVLYSAADDHLIAMEKQGTFFALGFVVMLTMAQISQSHWRLLAPVIYGLGVILVIAVALFGEISMGAQRWLAIPGLPRFQPSEILKIGLPLMLATYFHNRSISPRFKHVFWSLIMIVLPVALIIEQPDLGTGMLVLVSGVIVLFMAGIGWGYIITALTAAAALGPVMWFIVMHDYQRQRVLMLFDPESDKLGAGWNIIQSQTAIGSGGWLGKGWQHGTQSQLDFLPEGHTDFIIAVLSEELGYRGVLVLLSIYMLIVARGLWISLHAQETFGRLLGSAISITFFIYVFVNMGMVAGLLPVVGVPLPLVSQGGTAVIILMIGFGMLMAISTEKKRSSY
ncbi:MAG TPA: rod shape-determining protein RodA [Pseudomonadales bacterium]|nr:rod shape-determining protein RodA [Pseudomonadales bacterium]